MKDYFKRKKEKNISIIPTSVIPTSIIPHYCPSIILPLFFPLLYLSLSLSSVTSLLFLPTVSPGINLAIFVPQSKNNNVQLFLAYCYHVKKFENS
jgi:hypothetical protein